MASSLLAVAVAIALPYSPLAYWLGFVPIPAPMMGALALVTVTYLATVHWVKRWFYEAHICWTRPMLAVPIAVHAKAMRLAGCRKNVRERGTP